MKLLTLVLALVIWVEGIKVKSDEGIKVKAANP